MKKTTKFLLGGVLGILLLIPVSQAKADWHQDNVGWWYSLNNGSYYKNTEAKINGKWYKFDDRGYMMTGWQLIWERNDSRWGIIKNWSYFDPVNGDQKIGWQNIDGKWYYFQHSALKGSQNLDGKNYYFDPVNFDMQTGWVTREKASATRKYYYDLESGEQLSGWQDIDGKRYYFGEYGASSGRIYIEGKQYYFDSDTCELKIGWLELGKYKYYADPNDGGAFASNKTLIIDGVSYTFDYGGTLINNVP